MNALVKLLKILGWVALVFAVGVGGTLWYEHHERMEREKAELDYFTNLKWQWHDKYNRIQITYSNKIGRLMLRKVNMREKYIVYVYMNEDRVKRAIVEFLVDCKPNTKIVTSLKFSSGKPKELICNEKGDALGYGIVFGSEELDYVIKENLDGFKYTIDFRDWDFTKLDQEITLSNAREPMTEQEELELEELEFELRKQREQSSKKPWERYKRKPWEKYQSKPEPQEEVK